MGKSVFREIKSSLGRYLAILAIIALGTGFYTGLVQTRPSMMHTMVEYVRDTVLFDWRVVSSVGLDREVAESAAGVRGVRAAEGAVSFDALCVSERGSDQVMKAHSITETINKLTLKAGRMPEKPDECVADSFRYTAADISRTIRLSPNNDAETLDRFTYDEYTIVGIAASPLYINYERGNTTLGNGSVYGFFYIPAEGFAIDGYTELYLALDTAAEPYTEAYDRILRISERRIRQFADRYTEERWAELATEAAGYGPDALEALNAIGAPEIWLLSRKTNVGYVCFESDSDIVEGIARVFPLFFFLVAALVCITTMTRMVDEQRTEIGVLRALGFSSGRIIGKYLLYSVSASLIGCAAGFFAGSYVLPSVIWQTYQMMYEFGELHLLLDFRLGAAVTLIYLAISTLATYLACRRELRDTPANLLRPRAPKSGKRVLLERVGFLWKRLSFLQKAALRNLFRYRQRFLMMILGIGGCTALLLTGYGLRDSIRDTVEFQYSEITFFEYNVTFRSGLTPEELDDLRAYCGDDVGELQLVFEGSMAMEANETGKDTWVVAPCEGTLEDFLDFHDGNVPQAYPVSGEALVCVKLAEDLALSPGDEFTLRDADGNGLILTVSGIFDNYVDNYVYVSMDSFTDQWGRLPELKTVYAQAVPGRDVHATAAKLLDYDGVLSVAAAQDMKDRIAGMMQSMDYIVWLVIACSGALAFIVLYNLTNINIIERLREIATVKVLGFYPMETAAYVFRENLILTALGVLFGIPLGRALHAYVIRQIRVDLVRFAPHVLPASYFWAVAFTFLFALLVDVFLYFRLDRIHMAEALKSNE